jgi:hypothetical protein
MNNKRLQLFVVGALLGAQLILDTNVTLPSYDGGPAHIMSLKKIHLWYIIHNPTLEWACCNCVNAQHENICNHQFNILMLLPPNLTKGTIIWFYGSLKGAFQGGLKNLVHPQVGAPPHIMTTPPTSIHKFTTLGDMWRYKGHHMGVLHTFWLFNWNIKFGTLHNAKKKRIVIYQ